MSLAGRATAPRRLAPPVAATLAAMLLAGCASFNPDSRVVKQPQEFDYRKNHPIVLADTERAIDIFVGSGAGGIGERQVHDLRAFASDYRREGKGYLTVSIPASGGGGGHAIASIRRALAEGGVEYALESHYQPADPEAKAPVRVHYTRLTAEVATKCGRWPSDLSGNGGTLDGLRNQPWENFGCATNAYIAQQVADPLDLVRGRPEGPVSANRRGVVLRKYSLGETTGAQTPEGMATINDAVGAGGGS